MQTILLSSPSFIPSSQRRLRAALQSPPFPKTTKSRPLPKLPAAPVLTERAKLSALAEAAAERAEMHAIVGQQRDNWNHLFLHSINSMALTASLMSGLSSTRLSSAVLFASASALMLLVNRIQPSQLAEEQRNAARLFRQLQRSILSGEENAVEEAMEKVLALQRAYPLPLLPGMLEKFPRVVEPARWWPERRRRRRVEIASDGSKNGWSRAVEEGMRGVARALREKDQKQYLRCGELVLGINKVLALAGPLLAAAAAVASVCGGESAAAIAGAMAVVANTAEHAGQMGMVFELFRNCAGFYRRLEEEIEFALGEEEADREDGEVFELKMALRLGRSLAEIRGMASCANGGEIQEFAGKLF